MIKRPKYTRMTGYPTEILTFETPSNALIGVPSYTNSDEFPVEERENFKSINIDIITCRGKDFINAVNRIKNYPEFLFSAELIGTLERTVKLLDDQIEVVACQKILRISHELIGIRDNLKMSDQSILEMLRSYLNRDGLDEDQTTIDNFIIAMKNFVI